MNLWITRDMIGAVTMIWYGDCPPTIDNGLWHGDGKAFIMAGRDIPPGTCTELFTEQQVQQMLANSGEFLTLAHAIEQSKLFTEQQVRERVAKAVLACADDFSVKYSANAYGAEPTDENWARLMAEVGAE